MEPKESEGIQAEAKSKEEAQAKLKKEAEAKLKEAEAKKEGGTHLKGEK
jgi:membrane protein involved in colicin uptake